MWEWELVLCVDYGWFSKGDDMKDLIFMIKTKNDGHSKRFSGRQ